MKKPIPLILSLSALLTYSAVGQNISATKTATDLTQPQAHPGDTLKYTVVITNAANAAGSGTGVLYTDARDTNETHVAGTVHASPVAFDDAYAAIGNTKLYVGLTPPAGEPAISAGGSVLANDTISTAPDTITLAASTIGTTQGGSVAMNADGTFTYTPPVGFTGTDTFVYTIRNSADATLTGPGTVTITVSGKVWYVNNSGANGNGTSASPFNSLAGAAGTSSASDFIYVFQGSGNYTAGITLKNSQNLVGSGDALIVSGTTIFSAGSRPTILAASGTGVGLADANIVHGLNVGSGNGRAFSGASVGNLVISNVVATATGDRTISLTNGTVNVTLDSVTSTSSVDNGINLSSINGTFVVNGGSITGAAGTDFVVSGGNGTITYAGTINNTAGRSVDISGRTGGTVTLSGNITDTGMGIIVQNNTGGTTTFSGASKSLSTGANTAVSLTSNSGHTINFTGGGLAITTTSGTGFNATGGGTVTVTTGANNNTIGSGTGTALNVASTTIGASGLTFRSISSSGAASGIVLNNTGVSGGFTVTGDGGAANNGSGGVIASSTGIGVFVTNSFGLNLGYLNIQNSGTDGLRGGLISGGVTLNRCNLTDAPSGGATDDGVELLNVSGAVLIQNCLVATPPHNAIVVDNFNVNMASFTMIGNTLTNDATSNPPQNDGLLLVMRGNSVLPFGNIQSNLITGMRAVGVQIQANDTGRIGVNAGTITVTALTAANSIIVQNNTFPKNGQGIDIGTSQVSSLTFQVLNNTITGKITAPNAVSSSSSSTAINAFTAAGADTGPASHAFVGKIEGNTIGTQGVKDSGSGFGNGIRAVVQGQNTQAAITINTNTIREVPNAAIINIFGQNGAATTGTGTARYKITNNTMPAPSGSNLGLCGPANTPCADSGIFVLADEFFPVCTIITGNSIYDVSTMNGSFDIYLAERAGPPAGAQLTVEGTGGSNSTYIQANNTLTGASKFIDEGGNTSQVAAGACGTFP